MSCGPGLVECLEAELVELGYTSVNVHSTGVEIVGNLEDAMNLNLKLKTAYSVLYLLNEFSCMDPNELYRTITKMQWEELIGPDEYLSVISRVDTPTIDNSMFAGLKVKDAIVDRILKKTGLRPNSGSERSNLVFNLFWKDDRCWLYLNTSGRKMSDRGYRKIPGLAPLRETLAAAILMTAGYTGENPLVLPMCGSGTLAIEAAFIATFRAPGLLRSNYGFMHTKNFDKDNWQSLRIATAKACKKRAASKVIAPIIATDIDPDAIEAAKKIAMTAGVDHLIEFHTCDFADSPIPAAPAIVLLNPEYGHRVGDVKKLEKTYKRINQEQIIRCYL